MFTVIVLIVCTKKIAINFSELMVRFYELVNVIVKIVNSLLSAKLFSGLVTCHYDHIFDMLCTIQNKNI